MQWKIQPTIISSLEATERTECWWIIGTCKQLPSFLGRKLLHITAIHHNWDFSIYNEHNPSHKSRLTALWALLELIKVLPRCAEHALIKPLDVTFRFCRLLGWCSPLRNVLPCSFFPPVGSCQRRGKKVFRKSRPNREVQHTKQKPHFWAKNAARVWNAKLAGSGNSNRSSLKNTSTL